MGQEIPLFLFLFLSSFHLAISACVPRNSSLISPLPSSPSPAPSLAPSPSPTSYPAHSSPSPTPTSSPSPLKEASLIKGPSPSLSPLSSPAPVLSGGLSNAIEGLCGHTDHPDLCLSSISSLLPAFGTIDAKTLLTLEMKACRSQTEIAHTQASKIVNDGSAPDIANILQTCVENYEDALDNLDSATNALAEGDKGTLNTMLSALIDDYGTCDDGFAEMEKTSLMASYDDMLTKLASNCLAIAELVQF